MGIIASATAVSFCILLFSFVLYKWVLRVLIFFKGKRDGVPFAALPPITVIIPTFNEEGNIQRKLENLKKTRYRGKMSIIVSDDCSTDETIKVASEFKGLRLQVVVSKRNGGKVSAINNALLRSKTDIVVITDADALLEKESLEKLVFYFSDDSIGGVTGEIIIKAAQSMYRAGQEAFQKEENLIRFLEGALDSVSSMDGRLCAFRKSIVGKVDPTAPADDLVLAHQIKGKGFRAVFAKGAIAREVAPKNLGSELWQKRRRSLYTIAVVLSQVNMLFNPKYGYFGMLIFPFRRIVGILSPFLATLCIVGFVSLYPSFIPYVVMVLVMGMLLPPVRSAMIYNFLVLGAITLSWIDFLAKRGNISGKWRRVY